RLPVEQQPLDRLVAALEHGPIAQRAIEPAAQEAPAHRRGGVVHYAEEGVLVAPGEAAVELEVATRRRVHDQRLVAALGGEAAQVRQRAALRVQHVLQQAAGGL